MANSPPVQTPTLFLKGGGAGIFSADCVAKLLEAGYNPEWFGSYDHVKGQIDAAKARVAAHDNWNQEGPPPPLQPGDRYLANCQSGHISQDATHRQVGGRDDPCRYLQNGYSTNLAPCMPQTAGPWDPPGSEHNVASRHEVACAQRNQGPPPRPYTAAQREADEAARLNLVVNDRRPAEREPLTGAAGGTASASGGAGAAGEAAQATSGDPSKPSLPDDQKITGKSAADCINNFKKSAMQAMRAENASKRMANQEKNRLKANGRQQNPGESDADYQRAGEQHRQELQNTASERRKEADAAQGQRARLQQGAPSELRGAENQRERADAAARNAELPSGNPARADAAAAAAGTDARERGEAVQARQARINAAQSFETFADADARAAENAAGGASRAHCEANEGAMWEGMTPGQRSAAIANGSPRPGMPEARTPNVAPEQRADFNRTQADDPMGAISP